MKKDIYIYLLFSIVFILMGIFFISYDFYNLNYIKEEGVHLERENFCILRIFNKKRDYQNYFTSKKKIINKENCINKEDKLPVLTIYTEDDINSTRYIGFFLDSYAKMVFLNSSILFAISEIIVDGEELQFFLSMGNIRIDIKEYKKKNWERKLISLVIWIWQKNIKKGYLSIREEDSLLIYNL